MDDYKARFANPYRAAERGYIDDVILPTGPRPTVIPAFAPRLTQPWRASNSWNATGQPPTSRITSC